MRASIWSIALSGLLATVSAHNLKHAQAHAQRHEQQLEERIIVPVGGWSLKMEIGGSCPTATQTCFSNMTGVYNEFNRTGVPGVFSRGEECCPFGSSPRLDCGTYVNNGQPFACCPLG